jgi:hypothetical protein
MSDGSALSIGDEDAEVSDASEEAELTVDGPRQQQPSKHTATDQHRPAQPEDSTSAVHPPADETTLRANGAKPAAGVNGQQELDFDATVGEDGAQHADGLQHPFEAPKAPRNETVAQRARREHQEYLKQRDSNPAFVPNRGGFFLHDDRSPNVPNFHNKTFPRGRGRGYNGLQPAGYVKLQNSFDRN